MSLGRRAAWALGLALVACSGIGGGSESDAGSGGGSVGGATTESSGSESEGGSGSTTEGTGGSGTATGTGTSVGETTTTTSATTSTTTGTSTATSETTSAGETTDTTDTGDMPGVPVDLGTAGDFVILTKSGITNVPTSSITGDMGVSPAAAASITGFALILDPSTTFSTSTQVKGKVYAASYAVPTPAKLTTAIGDMQAAFTEAAGRAPDIIELGAGNIGGMTLSPGVYQWSSGLLIPSDVTLEGGSEDVWIFQIAQVLTVGSGASIVLSGGATAENVFWQVSEAVNLGTDAHLEGIVLTQTAVTMATGASIHGRLLAQTAVTLDMNSVVDVP